MKKIFLVLMTGLTLHLHAQTYPMYSRGLPVSYSDPAVSNLKFTATDNSAANTSMLSVGQAVKMSFAINNNESLNAVPAGTMQVKITLGSKFQMATALSQIPTLPLNEYFRWDVSPAIRNSQLIITGELVQDLPARYAGTIDFKLMPIKEGSSTVTCQVMISNNNPVTVLSDIAPSNNYISATYTNLKSVGMKFLQFLGNPHNCAVDLNWLISDENKQAKRFIVETSGDGINFVPVKTINATGGTSYTLSLADVKVKVLTVRIKAEMQDGNFIYSSPLRMSDICGATKMEVTLYPNPLLKDQKELTLSAKSGVFNGKYSLKLTDAAGKEINTTDATVTNQAQMKYNTGNITSGTYFITIVSEDGQSVSLPFVKMSGGF